MPVTHGVAGSSPVHTARGVRFELLFCFGLIWYNIMEKYIIATIGVMLILMAVTIAIMVLYAVWKLAFPAIKNKSIKYVVGTLCFCLLELSVSRCLMLGVELIKLHF